ncbi:serine/threonine protein kinase [Kribbella sp. NBC_00382]|uniref:serine/threonine-protein kinase n=1 Tax=Kribbella sp. NBC_00382 TaxID=2975967 RepID=UPI002E22F62F
MPVQHLYREVDAERQLIGEQLRKALAASQQSTEQALEGLEAFQGLTGARFWYDTTAPLGRPGSQGQVFSGLDQNREPVAVKRVQIRTDDPQREAIERKQVNREIEVAQLLAGSKSRFLVPIVDWAYVNDALLIVMPVATPSLAEVISANPDGLALAEVRQVVIDVANGLVDIHTAGIVHRDIKPQNILKHDGRWCLADFGISRILDVATATHTWMGTGTLEYRAPEVFRTARTTRSSDLYALGCVAFEAVTGNVAFPGPDFAAQHAGGIPALPDELDAVLSALIYRLLAKDPGSRPRQAEDLLDRLRGDRQLTAGQQRMQQHHAKATRLQLEQQARMEQISAREAQRFQATLALNLIWNDATSLAQRAVPETTSGIDENAMWRMTLDDRQLIASLEVFTGDMAPLLLIGELRLTTDEELEPGARLANLLATSGDDDSITWHIAQFAHNDAWPNEPLAPSTWGAVDAGAIRMNSGQTVGFIPLLARMQILKAHHIVDLFSGEGIFDDPGQLD